MENNGKGIFYGVIGVATLIVAIIGATFAFFTATASNAGTITGTAATAELDLSVTLASTSATGPMVPQYAEYINSATGATTSCVDANSNTVCKVYTVTITNKGSATAVVNGSITLTPTSSSTMTNLMWGKSTAATNGFTTYDDADTDIVGPGTDGDATISLDPMGGDNDSSTFYIVVFIDETDGNQNTTDVGGFTGTISFNSATGSGVTSTFTS